MTCVIYEEVRVIENVQFAEERTLNFQYMSYTRHMELIDGQINRFLIWPSINSMCRMYDMHVWHDMYVLQQTARFFQLLVCDCAGCYTMSK